MMSEGVLFKGKCVIRCVSSSGGVVVVARHDLVISKHVTQFVVSLWLWSVSP